MAQEKVLEIEIDLKTGAVTTDALGFVGKECEGIQDAIQKALLGQVLEKVNKSEKDQKVIQVQINHQTVKQ